MIALLSLFSSPRHASPWMGCDRIHQNPQIKAETIGTLLPSSLGPGLKFLGRPLNPSPSNSRPATATLQKEISRINHNLFHADSGGEEEGLKIPTREGSGKGQEQKQQLKGIAGADTLRRRLRPRQESVCKGRRRGGF